MGGTLSSFVSNGDRSGPAASLHIEVIADFVCPFSFIGQHRLRDALKAVQGPCDVSWHPYQLNPDIPVDGLPFDVYLTERFGTPASADPVLAYLAAEGEEAGIDFRFDKIRRVPNTLRAHQVMQLAESLGKDQSALAEDLMSSFFEQGLDIGDQGVLIDIAASHGLSAGEVRDAIGSDQLKQRVLIREGRIRSRGIAGIPGFLINHRVLVVGAQETENIVNAFDRAMFGDAADEPVSPVFH